MSPFAAALDALFSAPGSAAAVYAPVSGGMAAVRVIRRGSDRHSRFADTMIVPGEHPMDVRISEVPRPEVGDLFQLDDVYYRIVSDPVLDVEGVTWTCPVELHS